MNIAHRDILNKNALILSLEFQRLERIEDFAKLAFIFSPVQNGVILPFQVNQDADIPAIKCMRTSTAYLNFPQTEDEIAWECQAFHENLKTLSLDKRVEMWDSSPFLFPLHQRLKELIPLNRNSSTVEVFHQITGNPNFCQFNNAIFDGTNPWNQIYQEIWDHERVVIVNMDNGREIGHALIAYATIHYYYNDRQVILMHDPATGLQSNFD
ncbi:MAG: hypothetical protein LBS28_01025 [Streptococcaceae bacterium]|jgi:hypothetical protein|nr:hypothetical protein [Streptococcaceae bacterium]